MAEMNGAATSCASVPMTVAPEIHCIIQVSWNWEPWGTCFSISSSMPRVAAPMIAP